MGLYVNSSEFAGQDNIAQDKFSVNDLDLYIDKYEVRYLQDLLGCKLYEDFATDFAITGVVPTAPKFQEIWNPICLDDSLCIIRRSEGIKDMLLQFIYFEYLRDNKVKNNIGGQNVNVQANSNEAEYHITNIYTNYNQAIESYSTIQWIICDNPNNYSWEDYNGQLKEKTSYL